MGMATTWLAIATTWLAIATTWLAAATTPPLRLLHVQPPQRSHAHPSGACARGRWGWGAAAWRPSPPGTPVCSPGPPWCRWKQPRGPQAGAGQGRGGRGRPGSAAGRDRDTEGAGTGREGGPAAPRPRGRNASPGGIAEVSQGRGAACRLVGSKRCTLVIFKGFGAGDTRDSSPRVTAVVTGARRRLIGAVRQLRGSEPPQALLQRQPTAAATHHSSIRQSSAQHSAQFRACTSSYALPAYCVISPPLKHEH